MRLFQPRAARALSIVAFLATAPLLAGCLEASGAALDEARAKVGLPPDEVPARSLADEAADEAAAWNASAVLVGVSTVELGDMPGVDEANEAEDADANESGEGDASEGMPPKDPDVANGKAPAWYFAFETEDAILAFRVDVDGTVSEREERAKEKAEGDGESASMQSSAGTGRRAIGEWPVNSHEAWETVAGNATWQEAMTNVTPELASSTLFSAPEEMGEAPEGNATEEPAYVARWVILAMNETGHGAGAVVNALNGTIEAVFPWMPFDFDFDFDWGWDGGSGSWGGWSGFGGRVECCDGEPSFSERYTGRVTLLEDTMRHDVPVSADGEAVFLLLEQQSPGLIGPGVSVRLLGPDDEEVELEQQDWMNFGFNSPGARYVAYPPGPGAYVLEVTLNMPNLIADYSAEVEVGVPLMVEEKPEEDDGPTAGLLPRLPVGVPVPP